MRVVYDNIRKANPSLEFQQGNFQRSLQAGQGGSFAAFHSMYYSTTLRYRLTTMTSPSFQQIRDHDAAIVVCSVFCIKGDGLLIITSLLKILSNSLTGASSKTASK